MSLKIVSVLGNNSSLLPLYTKDVVNSLGMTAFSYDAGGKIEAKDRFIDEFGTEAIWIGGLPFFKWGINKTLYKAKGLNPNIDVRLVRDKEQFNIASKYAEKFAEELKDSKIVNSLKEAGSKSKLFKNLFLTKFAAATALTLGSFFTLVKMRQNYTKKQVEKKFWENKAKERNFKSNISQSTAFKGFIGADKASSTKALNADKQQNKNLSFKGIPSFLQGFMFDPVKNMFIIDAGITGERLGSSRTKSEFAEYAIKEGSLLFFLYIAGKYVQKGMEHLSEKVFKKPINLNAEFLSSKALKNSMENGQIVKDVETFKKAAANSASMYEFIYDVKNADNIVVKAAKECDMLSVLKNVVNGKKVKTNMINPHQYIDPKEMNNLADNLMKIVKSHKESGQSIEKFLKSSTRFKIGSVVANLGVSCLFLGLIVPYAMMKYRQKQNGSKEYHVEKEIQKDLENNFKARLNK